jgi:polyisoprenoid-binding protein YceI
MTGNTNWTIDPGHSEVQFKIKHLAITNVTGKFKVFQGSLMASNDDFDHAVVQAVIDAGSIDTNNPQRDVHLRSPDFLAVEQFPAMQFEGRLQKGADGYMLDGELGIRETRRPVRLSAEFSGMATGRFGDVRAGFEITGKINRKDFGLTWNILAEGGGLVLGEDINLHFDIQLIRQG